MNKNTIIFVKKICAVHETKSRLRMLRISISGLTARTRRKKERKNILD